MNADLHMAEDLKNTGKGNLFVIFGEPDITLTTEQDGRLRVKVNGVDVFKPQTGEIVSSGADGIACWFIDTDYNEESFFVRHAYFLGANDPYSALKTTLKAEINQEAWEIVQAAVGCQAIEGIPIRPELHKLLLIRRQKLQGPKALGDQQFGFPISLLRQDMLLDEMSAEFGIAFPKCIGSRSSKIR